MEGWQKSACALKDSRKAQRPARFVHRFSTDLSVRRA
jgi:hypothetical protein